MTRKPLLAGNWKMHKKRSELEDFFSSFRVESNDALDQVDVMFAAPYTLLRDAVGETEPTNIKILAQNVHQNTEGAFTGEVSIPMLKEVGVHGTLLGHSERRQYFNESDASVAEKVAACQAANMLAVVCVGELLAERENEQTDAIVSRQVHAFLNLVAKPEKIVIAYEPVWAIGTGLTATPKQAQAVHALIRQLIADKLGSEVADTMRILYGGSAKPANIADLMQQSDVDGGLVGGASLKPADFAAMVRSVAETR